MLQTTLQEDIIPLVKKSLISAWTESENSLINALDSKDSSSSTPSVVVLDQVLDLSFWKDCQLIMVKNPNWASLYTHPHKSQQQSLSHTTQCSQLTPFWNTLMSLSCWTMRQSTISAEEISILKDPPTPT